jgi:hypothetical protein
MHVPLLSFLGFREVLGNVFYIDEWPGEIISLRIALSQEAFVGKPAAPWR